MEMILRFIGGYKLGNEKSGKLKAQEFHWKTVDFLYVHSNSLNLSTEEQSTGGKFSSLQAIPQLLIWRLICFSKWDSCGN